MFPRLEYLEWISGRPEVAMHDLGSSDLRGDRDHEPEAVPDPLVGLEDPPVGASLEMQLAAEYGVDPDQVLLTPGASTANFVAAAAALDAELEEGGPSMDDDDADTRDPRVLVEKPAYEPLVETPRALGGNVDRFLREDDYRLNPERAANATVENTRLVAATNRHNPSGVRSDRDTLLELADVAADCDARLLVDEVYAPYGSTPDESESTAFGAPTVADVENTVVTSSLTKFFGLGDLRVGWLVADAEFVSRARSVAHHIPGFAGTSRALGMRALHNKDTLVERSRDLAAENSAALDAFLDARDDVDGFVPEGSTFAFLDPENVDGDELAAAAWDEGVLVVPGRFFDDPERVRVSLGRTPESSTAALDALGVVLDSFR
ncbi:pyridoxal phosphate-dependent aminotransferase [Halobacterium zhouii]|uniref:pyridoxal phosphate-dependent aminotransferase n=1 Tax=Halobacterium zhouii TaxID=2902624 RepID=UPI001E4B6EC6|nr:pyridoxal phosphate-dependent aminotransferase [Halobacterium zhouii]